MQELKKENQELRNHLRDFDGAVEKVRLSL